MKFLLIAVFLTPHFSLAVTPEQVVKSSLQHYPQVIESVQKLEQSKNQAVSARGAFDGKVVGEIDSRTEGFYTGDAYSLSLEKPLPVLNSKVYVGQRQGFGDFPSYEGKFETLNQGEVFAGASLSLLRDSLIDSNRYNIKYLKQNELQAEVDLRQTQINVQTMALKAYWMWLIKGHELKVHEEILALAKNRAKNISRRIRAGDLAKIYGVENDQYIVKRQVQVSLSQLAFQEASFYLSLFYRGSTGDPILLPFDQIPPLQEKSLQQINNYETIYQGALQENLDLKILGSQERQAELDVRIGTNDLLPKLDVKFEWNQDQGVGPNRLTQDENRVMLNLEIPFQYRKGLGKQRAGKAKLAQVKTKQQLAAEKLKVTVQSLVAKLNSFSDIYKLTTDQVELANKLAWAERKKFSKGASDLILVNIREENFAEAQAKNLSALLKYHFVEADVKNIQVNFISQ